MKNLKKLILVLSCLKLNLYSMENEEKLSVKPTYEKEQIALEVLIADLDLEEFSNKDEQAIPIYDNFQKKLYWIKATKNKDKLKESFKNMSKEEINNFLDQSHQLLSWIDTWYKPEHRHVGFLRDLNRINDSQLSNDSYQARAQIKTVVFSGPEDTDQTKEETSENNFNVDEVD